VQKGAVVAEYPEIFAAETVSRRANSRKCRVYFCMPDKARRDATGWLGRQDSNPGMAESKSPQSTSQQLRDGREADIIAKRNTFALTE
jgi:hypothetical protein